MRIFSKLFPLITSALIFTGCSSSLSYFKNIDGFDENANSRINQLIQNSVNEKGRKIAVFDGDGTVLGQVPHYLADECMYIYAKEHPDKHPEIIQEMVKQSNVSLPYVQNRVKFIEGLALQDYRDLGEMCYEKYYPGKVYPQMKELISVLKKNNFEVWIVSASPEGMYQQFLSKELEIPVTNIIGVKSIIRNGIITSEIIPPVPQDHGKKEAIESFIQDRPLIVGGNSRGDKEMIEYSKGLKLIVNPDEFVAPDQTESVADYARKNGWLILKIKDIREKEHLGISGKEFKIKENKSHDIK